MQIFLQIDYSKSFIGNYHLEFLLHFFENSVKLIITNLVLLCISEFQEKVNLDNYSLKTFQKLQKKYFNLMIIVLKRL